MSAPSVNLGSLYRQAGTSLAAAMPGEEESLILEASRVDLEDRWATACKKLHCVQQELRPGRMTALASWIEAPSGDSLSGCGAAEVQGVGKLPLVVQIAVHTPDNNFRRSQAILLAGHHTLDDLRKAMICSNDKYSAQQLGSAASGGYMLLNDVLYVDSAASAQEYTAPILSFLEERNSSIDHRITRYLQTKGLAAVGDLRQSHTLPSVQNMQNVRFCDLTLRPGQHGRYMYGHCGACEHMLVVEDVRVKHATDPDLTGPPVTADQHVAPLHRCCICAVRPSTKMAWGDSLAPSSPAFFCSWCYDDLHYGADGKQILDQPQMDIFDVEV